MIQERTKIKRRNVRLFFLIFITVQKASPRYAFSFVDQDFFETEECDEFHDFRVRRNDIRNKIENYDNGTLNRILHFKENARDEMIGDQILAHYNTQSETSLSGALNTNNWLYYHTVENVEYAFRGARQSMLNSSFKLLRQYKMLLEDSAAKSDDSK